jgi:hypothetical protein
MMLVLSEQIIAETGSAEESPNVTVRGRIIDVITSNPIPARIHIRDASGKWYVCTSEDGSAVQYRKEPDRTGVIAEVNTTISAHPFTATLPPGAYTFRIERGKEYLPIVQEVRVYEDMPPLDFRLQRWIDMTARGWYSGDTHTHRRGPDLPNILLAEDLNVALPLNYWVTRDDELPDRGKKSTSEPLEPHLIEVDSTHVIYPLNTEYEIVSVKGQPHTLGAVFVLNHKTKLDLGVPPVAPVAQRARAEGALLDLDKHSWPWSLMLVPVMDVDLFELANNHHWQTAFGFKNWTLEQAPAYMNLEMDANGFTEWGWTEFGFKTYYALLNCGYRMRVSAGTASGVHPVHLGFSRVYVHLPEGFSYEHWMRGLNAGNSFVTNGPMLDVRFNGRDAGRTFTVERGEDFTVHVTGSAFSHRPLDRIELIRAGDVANELHVSNNPLPGGGFENSIDAEIYFDTSSWIAIRCFERDPDSRVRFAHTNPAFVEIAGKPLSPQKDEAKYLVQRMQEEVARNRNVLDEASLAEYRKALAAFSAKLEQAR